MNQFLMEKINVKAGEPVDMNTAAITGPRIKVDAGYRLAFLINMSDSVAAVVDFTVKQHTAAAGGTTKNLATENPYFVKAATATSFTKVVPASATANYVLSTTFANEPGQVVFEVLAEDLDVNGGFGWVSLDVADSNAAKLISICHIVHEPKVKPAYAVAL